jgi:formylglycine-generating enzyme required for sulfatase activity
MKRLLVIEILTIALVGCSGANANKSAARPRAASPIRIESTPRTVTPKQPPPAGMVLVPDATFEFRNGEQKQRAEVGSFYIDRYEVSLQDFNKFLASSGYRTSAAQAGEAKMFKDVNSQGPKYPVGFMSMRDAKAFCGSSGKRLPTPQEWQLAALGVDGRLWPWGSWSVKTANVHTSGVAKIGSFPNDKSPSGAFDMGGNVLEWTTEGSMGGSYVGDTDAQNPTTLIKNLDDWETPGSAAQLMLSKARPG